MMTPGNGEVLDEAGLRGFSLDAPEGLSAARPRRVPGLVGPRPDGAPLRLPDRGDRMSAPSISWSFRTSAGVLRIKHSRARPDRFVFSIDDLPIGSYQSPEVAAADVFCAATGGPRELDRVLEVEAPTDLGKWTRHGRLN